jgi:hypothetical protein
LVNNLFDDHHALYGTYFAPSSMAGLVTLTLTLRRPVSFRLGARLKL